MDADRAHNLGRGSLVVLDLVPDFGTPSHEQRRAVLESLVTTDAVFSRRGSSVLSSRPIDLDVPKTDVHQSIGLGLVSRTRTKLLSTSRSPRRTNRSRLRAFAGR